MSHMTRKHITQWLGCIFCETCSKASMTMKIHKEVDHKNSELITNFTSFFDRRNRLIAEKMFPMLRSTSIWRFLHPSGVPVINGATPSSFLDWLVRNVNCFLAFSLQETTRPLQVSAEPASSGSSWLTLADRKLSPCPQYKSSRLPMDSAQCRLHRVHKADCHMQVSANLEWEVEPANPRILLFRASDTEPAHIIVRPKGI